MANGLIDFGITRPNAAMETYQQGQQNQLAQLQMNQAQQAIQDAEAERNAYKGAANYGEVQQRLMQQGLGKQALAVSAAQAKQQADKIALHKDKLTLMKAAASRAMADPANAETILMDYAKQTGDDVTSELERLRANGGDIEKNRMWAAGHAVEADKLLPKFQHFDTGGAVQMGTVNPVSGAFTPGSTVKKTMSPDAVAADARARENIQIARDRENRLAQGPMGTTLTPDQNDALFGENGAVSLGKLNPNKINSRNAKMWADAFLKNPSADPVKVAQDVATADKAVKDFGTGPQGVKVVAFNTAIDHLETLDELGLALKGGDVQRFNALANRLGVEAGQPAATMYNQAAKIVGGEISKAIVPGVGTGKEREEAAAAFNSAMSPDQLVGASTTAKKLLGGQLSSLEAQYARTTKRKDFADQFLSPAARAAYQRSRPATESAAPSKGSLSAAEQAELDQLRARFKK